jgi:hypothetical protein
MSVLINLLCNEHQHEKQKHVWKIAIHFVFILFNFYINCVLWKQSTMDKNWSWFISSKMIYGNHLPLFNQYFPKMNSNESVIANSFRIVLTNCIYGKIADEFVPSWFHPNLLPTISEKLWAVNKTLMKKYEVNHGLFPT